MTKFLGDVRPSSADMRYMGEPFTGPFAHAKKQARNAVGWDPPKSPIRGVSRARYELLKFLRVLP